MKKKTKFININMFLYIGVALIVIASTIQITLPNVPSVVSNVLYIVGILSFIVYMFEIQYRRRTGDERDDGIQRSKKSKKK